MGNYFTLYSYYDTFFICSTFFATFTDRAVNSEHS